MLIYKRLSLLGRLSAGFFTSAVAALLLSGCGPEAPPCSDPETLQSVLEMVTQAHDDHLKGLPHAAKDLASFKLDAVVPTAYDEKLKMRSCKAVFVMTLQPEAAESAEKVIKAATNPVLNALQRGFGALAGAVSPFPEETRLDIARLQILNPGPIRPDPIRQSLTYQIQKQEDGKGFMVSTNVSASGTVPYLRVASFAQKFVQTAVQEKAKVEDEKARKEAEIDRLSATGTWRKVVYIMGFGEPGSVSNSCHSRGLYCFQGWNGKNQFETTYYQFDGSKFDTRARDAMAYAHRNRQPLCLMGIQKTSEQGVFSAKDFSTITDDKGQVANCETAPTVGTAPVSGSASPAAAAATQPAAASAASAAPENVPSLITRYEACGEEAVCLHTAKGNTIYMQASQMRHADYAMLDEAIKSRSTVCVRELVRTEGKSFTAESLDTKC